MPSRTPSRRRPLSWRSGRCASVTARPRSSRRGWSSAGSARRSGRRRSRRSSGSATSTTSASPGTRAEQLAERGSGDALIRDDLERRGLAADVVELALGALEPERERAARIAERRGRSVKTARYLASRGFGEDALEGIVAADE